MELFIESPRRVREREEWRHRACAERQVAISDCMDLDEPNMHAFTGDDAAAALKGRFGRRGFTWSRSGRYGVYSESTETDSYASCAADAYRAELSYNKKRAFRCKLGHVLRLLSLVVAVPLAVIAVFVASYALTFILNGASPEEVLLALQGLFANGWDVLANAFAS